MEPRKLNKKLNAKNNTYTYFFKRHHYLAQWRAYIVIPRAGIQQPGVASLCHTVVIHLVRVCLNTHPTNHTMSHLQEVKSVYNFTTQ